MSDLWPGWRTDQPPSDGSWFTARKGLSGYITRARWDAEAIFFMMAPPTPQPGAFVDEADREVFVSQWWPEGEGQPAVPAMPKPVLTEITQNSGLFELNGAPLSREKYVELFKAIDGQQRTENMGEA